MKEILIFTLLFWFGIACFAKVLFLSIQRGQWLDTLFGWQKKLREMDIRHKPIDVFLSKIGGNCELCFSHAIAFLGYWSYLTFMLIKSHWITSHKDGVLSIIFLNVIWYLIFVCGGTVINLWFILKLFNKKK